MRRAMLRSVVLSLVLLAVVPPAGATTADDLCGPAVDPCEITTSRTIDPFSVLDFGARTLIVRSTGRLIVPSGSLTIRASTVRVEPNGRIFGTGSSIGANVTITATGNIEIQGAGSTNGQLDVSAGTSPGTVDLIAGGNIVVSGFLESNGTATNGFGGVVTLSATGDITLSGAVKMKGGSYGLGGFLTVEGQSITVSGLLEVSAGDGGIIDFSAVDDITQTAGGQLVLKAAGDFGDGGEMDMFATNGDIRLLGQTIGQGAGSYTSGGGSGASILLVSEAGSITLAGTMNWNGAAPDGEGGELDLDAAEDIIQTGPSFGHGNGIDTCGGFLIASAGRDLTFANTLRVDAGSCGAGVVDVIAGNLATLSATLDGTGAAYGPGASVTVSAGRINVTGRVNVSAVVEGATAGQTVLDGCQIDVPAGGQLQANGAMGENRLVAGGQITIGGTLSATLGGVNLLEYRNAATSPVILGGALITPAATLTVNPALPACTISGAVCGNSTQETGEQCDDGNTDACDGCSASCRTEVCGNRVIECGEECDNGPGNGAPGNACSATCEAIEIEGVLLKPGKRVGTSACLLEWALRNPGGAVSEGFPETRQVCMDGDPACDGDDAIDGTCVFRAAACLAPVDARLPKCNPAAVASAQMKKPNPLSPPDATEAANAAALLDAFQDLGITVTFKDAILSSGVPNPTRGACSEEFDLVVPHPAGTIGTRLVKVGATDAEGRRLRGNRMALVCAPNPAVCGNNLIEVGETCDDGNAVACDGCNARCRGEGCGNGIVDCGEDCDEGALNGTPGASCAATCTEAPPALRIPGGARATDCLNEWSLAIGTPTLSKNGLPHVKQTCVDNDPSCDFDPTVGNCRFHLWTCVGGDDVRIGCAGQPIAAVDVIRPSVAQAGFPAAARVELLDALTRLSLPTAPGEQCSGRADLDVPAGRSRLALRVGATGQSGTVDRDPLKLFCVAAP